jgi:hypothetical protein
MYGLRRQGQDYGLQLRRPKFADLSNIDQVGLLKAAMPRVMTVEATKLIHEKLIHEEFASLLMVGNATVRSSAPVIPAEHSARLIALGYMVYLAGRLRMTTPGRVRIYAGQLAD